MPFCSICDKERNKLEMMRDKEQPDGIGTVCVFCRDERNRLKHLRLQVYDDSLSEMATLANKDMSVKEMLKMFEKIVFAMCVKQTESVAEMARVLGIERSTLSMKIAAANMQIKNGAIIERSEADYLSGRLFKRTKEKGIVWRARISIQSDRLFLGKFGSKAEADHVYRLAHYHQDKYQRNDRAGFINMILKLSKAKE